MNELEFIAKAECGILIVKRPNEDEFEVGVVCNNDNNDELSEEDKNGLINALASSLRHFLKEWKGVDLSAMEQMIESMFGKGGAHE